MEGPRAEHGAHGRVGQPLSAEQQRQSAAHLLAGPGDHGPTGPTNLPDQVDDPRVDQPVARGPQIMNAQVNTELLDPTRGLLQGTASLTRNGPMLQAGRRTNSRPRPIWWTTSGSTTPAAMGMISNQTRRIPIIYTLPQAPGSLANAYIQAILAIINAPFQQQLAMSRDGPNYRPSCPSFAARTSPPSSEPVQNLIDQIQGKKAPRRRAWPNHGGAYPAMYQLRSTRPPGRIPFRRSQIPSYQT